jgi:FixJ family two-component response regulator
VKPYCLRMNGTIRPVDAGTAEEDFLARHPVVSIIDDDPSVRAALGSLVRSLGFVARTFESAESFLGSPDVAETSCIVTDIQMPGMSGLDLQSRLDAAGSAIPMVFITAFPEEHLRARAEAGGAVGFLAKPFDGQTLAHLLVTAIG